MYELEGMNLTPHFTYKEMTASKSHPEVRNVPDEKQVENLITVCLWLEKLRDRYNKHYPSEDGKEQPIKINSGYRSPMLNRAVGGQVDSNHLTGCAVDIRCEDCKQAVRYAAILIEIFDEHKKDWDEIILERNRTKFWLHFAVRKEGNRRKVTCVSV